MAFSSKSSVNTAHPKQRIPDLYPEEQLALPFESENNGAMDEARVLKEQRISSGNLPDQPVGAEVKNDRPFKNLKTGR